MNNQRKTSGGMPYMIGATVLALATPVCAIISVQAGGDGFVAIVPCLLSLVVLVVGLVLGKVKFFG